MFENLSLPEERILEKVRRGEIDPEDIDIEKLIEDFRKSLEGLKSADLMPYAGRFIYAIAGLLKLKVEKLFRVETPKEGRKKVKLEEVLQAISSEEKEGEEDSLDWLWDYQVRAGRPQGSKDTAVRVSHSLEEPPPLHKEFKVEEYMQVLKELNLSEFERFQAFLLNIKDRIERVRFFLAWLLWWQDHG